MRENKINDLVPYEIACVSSFRRSLRYEADEGKEHLLLASRHYRRGGKKYESQGNHVTFLAAPAFNEGDGLTDHAAALI